MGPKKGGKKFQFRSPPVPPPPNLKKIKRKKFLKKGSPRQKTGLNAKNLEGGVF